jgi:hypothetical protein
MTKSTTSPTTTVDEIFLPTTPIKATVQNPENLIIFSKPKVGKTSLLAKLENCLIFDLEEGSNYVDALKIKINNYTDISKYGEEIKKQGKPYKYIAIDTITALEEMCIPFAEKLYANSSTGASWFKTGGGKEKYGNILGLPNGGGYFWLRQAFDKVIDYVKTLAPHVILIGHVKDIVLDKNGTEVNALDLDLTGKLKRITASNSDAIGYLYRKGNQNILSFKTTDEVGCGARPAHLQNKEIIVSTLEADGTLTTHWEQIFIN